MMPLDKRVGAWKAAKAEQSQTAINGLNRSIAKATQDFLSEVKEVRKKEQQEKEQEKEQSIKQEQQARSAGSAVCSTAGPRRVGALAHTASCAEV